MTDYLTYEQPLNERIRTFLRIEHLFSMINHYSEIPDAWDARLTISSLLELSDLLGRSDIKTEVAKELERHASILIALNNNPGVDASRLQKVLDNIEEYLSTLRNNACQPGTILKSDELITSIKQRSSMPGGTCNFDLPNYHHWLHRPREIREQHMREWQKDLLILRDSVSFALNMIRNSANPSKEMATKGFYQKPIDSDPPGQLIRIILPSGSKYFPEISGGKHRFSVRFMEQTLTTNRAAQSEKNIEFELHLCAL